MYFIFEFAVMHKLYIKADHVLWTKYEHVCSLQ